MLLPRKWALSLGLLAAVPGLTVAGPMDFLKGSPDAAATTPERANQEVADDIGQALSQAKLAYKDVSIEYLAGTATIKGQIKDASQRAMVTRIISEVPGVRTVENKLTLIEGAAPATRPVSAASHEASHAAAAHEAAAPVQHAAGTQAASKPRVQQVNHETAAPQSNQAVAQGIADALTSAGLSGYDIEIRYKNGVASLIGSVDAKDQAVMAQRATMSVPGVTQVLNRLTVNGQPVNIPPTAGAPGYGPTPGMPPQGMAQGGPQGAMPAGYQQGYGAPPQGYGPPPGMPMQGYGPPPGMPPQGAQIQQAQAQAMAAGGMQAPMPQYGNVQQTGHHIYNQPNMPNYAWPTYAPYDNSAAISYPTQYDASAFPYIGPYYPYPQVPLGWRKSTLEWDDGYWSLKFDSKTDRWWWFLNPHNWH